jgi:class 3 adenylate cyclase
MPTAETANKTDVMTLAEFLERYPWPADWLKKGKPMHFFWMFDLPVSVEKLWPYIADLSSFNKRVGLGEMKFTEKNGRLQGFAVNVGTKMYWEEVPWEWEYGKEFSHARVYSQGLPYYMRARYLFEEPQPGKCRLYVYLSWIPRGPVSRLLINIGLKQIKKGYAKALKEITEAIQRQKALAPPAPPAKLPAPVLEKLKIIRQKLVEGGTAPGLADRMIRYAQDEPDETLYRIRVKTLAREWQMREKDLLLAFLSATRLGLFNLTWDVLCPHCRGVRNEVRNLGDLPRRGNCEVCKIDFDATSFNVLEVTFHVHPSIRPVEKRVYCAAEPGTKPHIKVQKTIQPQRELPLKTFLDLGRYRLRVQGTEVYNLLDITEDSSEGQVLWQDSLAQQNFKSTHFPTVVLKNTSPEAKTFILEENKTDQDTLRPVDLFSFQGFRDLFSQEALAADIKLEIGLQTILFTDLVGSTKFYETEGDTVAFAEVRSHFLKAYEAVREQGGAVVKTIGDAVMAAFARPADAMKAAVELQKYFNGKNPQTRLRLRVTLNAGSCLAVNLNSNIDYFGNTVNLSAKIQAVAGASQIGFTEQVFNDPEVKKYLEAEKLPVEKLDFEMKWAKKTIPVYRVEVK